MWYMCVWRSTVHVVAIACRCVSEQHSCDVRASLAWKLVTREMFRSRTAYGSRHYRKEGGVTALGRRGWDRRTGW